MTESGKRAERGTAGAPQATAAGRPEAPHDDLPTGTVVEVYGVLSLVSVGGRTYEAHLPKGVAVPDPEARSPLAVGDRVKVEILNEEQVRIAAVEPRQRVLSRTDGFNARRRHVIATNIDQVILVVTPDRPPFRPRLIDRYLVAAAWDDLPVILCLNKIDLGVGDEVNWYLEGYRRLGIPVFRTSAKTGEGIDALRERFRGRTSLVSGHSGVGKSSILNAVEPGLNLRVGETSEATAGQGKGRHTTVTARLVPVLGGEGFVVDSPGIRAFGIAHLTPDDLAGFMFAEAEGAGACRFSDCLHESEPGCAVRRAAEGDEFTARRLDSYREMLEEVRTAQGR